MYLPDIEIRKLLPELGITTSHAHHPFDEERQVQPCSIDLRLSDHFWRPSRRRARWRRVFSRSDAVIDLRQAHMEELDARRDWRPVVLGEGRAFTIKPGQALMGRIYERFSIPPSCAGKVEGRSSYARLGLQVHCTGDFINPGWGGYMPLQLFNAGPYPIRITPFAPVCQLMLVQLQGRPERIYGAQDLQSKYVNDDGGPSFWWRDEQIRKLHVRFGSSDVAPQLEREVVDIVRFRDPEMLARFQAFVGRSRLHDFANADDLLQAFSDREVRRRWLDRFCTWLLPAAVSTSAASFFAPPIGTLHYIAWAATLLAIPVFLRGLAAMDTDYFDGKALQEARDRNRPDESGS